MNETVENIRKTSRNSRNYEKESVYVRKERNRINIRIKIIDLKITDT